MEQQDLAARLANFDAPLQSDQQREADAAMIGLDAMARLAEANRRSSEQWRAIDSPADWQRFADARLEALRRSLGPLPSPRGKPPMVLARMHPGQGYRIDNIAFESRPGVVVPANVYVPDPPPARPGPGIVICHSHHRPKHQPELQDMGVTWARAGATVIVPDMLGHGERRQQPFGGRQDYHHRYVLGMQMHVVGESLMGWFVYDLSRCVDVLLDRPEVDPQRIILLGAVAGGGDPAAVTAALDGRVACAIPFNFGGPQPESPYPLPPDAEEKFNYAGWAYWESTRNLRDSARDGFLPWVIVGAIVPRKLVYAHEFAWDRDRDPVWRRLQRLWQMHLVSDNLDAMHGSGNVRGRPPEATHCTNVGPVHRAQIYPMLQRWFDMPIPEETQDRVAPELLDCITPEVARQLRPRPLFELLGELADQRLDQARQRQRAAGDGEPMLEAMRRDWAAVLGPIKPTATPAVKTLSRQSLDGVTLERLTIRPTPGVRVGVELLRPESANRPGVVACVAQQGAAAFRRERSDELAGLLGRGSAVCLVEVRGTGATDPGGSRFADSPATEISAVELMLGQTMLGLRLADLRTVLAHLRTRHDLAGDRVALWGDSFAPTNPADLVDPPAPASDNKLAEADQPIVSEPLGATLALLAALCEPDVRAVLARGGLVDFAAVLAGPFCYVPHDTIVPGVLLAGDLPEVAMALRCPVRVEAAVDGRNVLVVQSRLERVYSRSAVSEARTDPTWLAEAVRPSAEPAR